MSKPCTVERTPRSVIERKLLAALDDENKVAALLSREDLDLLISALDQYGDVAKAMEFAQDLRQLRREAFR